MSSLQKSATAFALLLLLTACEKRAPDGGESTPPPPEDATEATTATGATPGAATPSPAGGGQSTGQERPLLTIAGDDAGTGYLTDAAGQALYVLEDNAGGQRCDAACEEAWPPVLTEEARPLADPRIGAGGAGALPRQDGGQHVTYRGQPLYRYAADRGAGRTAGDGVEDQWGRWSVVEVDGAPAAGN